MNNRDVTHSTTLNIKISSQTKSNLEQLARATKRTKSFLAAVAIEEFVARELEIIDGHYEEGITRSLIG